MTAERQDTTTGTDEFLKGLWAQNPVFVQVLGMCPVLAVTNTAQNALAMGLATAFVLVMSNIAVSSIRRTCSVDSSTPRITNDISQSGLRADQVDPL